MAIDLNQSSYIELRDIIKKRIGSVVFWVGSGISSPYGLPTWNELKEKLIKELDKKIENIDENDIEKLTKKKDGVLASPNNWIAFERLKKALGKTTYNSRIRELLSHPQKESDLYKRIWSLGISGMINLNIDKLASIGFQNVFNNNVLSSFAGNSIDKYCHTINNPNKFLLNLHGNLEDTSSWVFTHNELKELMESDAYTSFLDAVIISKTIVFIGISADDVSTGGHIEKFVKKEINLSQHFWITNRRDLKTDEWAEKTGIHLIKYKNEKNHSEILELLSDISNYKPKEQDAPVVVSKTNDTKYDDLPSPKDLLKEEDAEIIRLYLNEEASRIFNSNKINPYDEFSDFIKKYDQALHRAWYTSINEPDNELLGYTLIEEKHNGNFGDVFKAKDDLGNSLAIKLLQNSVRKKEEYIQGFRRGIKSMKILNKHNIDGMAKLIDASEIPAIIIMDWINGSNLKEVVQQNQLTNDIDFLSFFIKLTKIINSAHLLPENVLHRDIRPTNIMIGWHDGELDLNDIHVLDFDLAWYKSSIESKEVSFSIGNGYLAPEQLVSNSNISTINAAVDSFGVGMTLFFVICGKDPQPSQQKHSDWYELLNKYSRKYFSRSNWKSMGNRMGRLVRNCTMNTQSKRWDFSQIIDELKRLKIAALKPNKVLSCDLIAEEICFRSRYKDEYEWDEDKLKAIIKVLSGTEIEVIGNENTRSIDITFNWVSVNNLKSKTRSNAKSYIEYLISKNFTNIEENIQSNQLCISASISSSNVSQNYKKYAEVISTLSSFFI
ncbi:MAG: protein kinase [Candidatus Cloacimonetes bacterium]|nr:protein kinase [Candidatus Cloacimonadota bacterium]